MLCVRKVKYGKGGELATSRAGWWLNREQSLPCSLPPPSTPWHKVNRGGHAFLQEDLPEASGPCRDLREIISSEHLARLACKGRNSSFLLLCIQCSKHFSLVACSTLVHRNHQAIFVHLLKCRFWGSGVGPLTRISDKLPGVATAFTWLTGWWGMWSEPRLSLLPLLGLPLNDLHLVGPSESGHHGFPVNFE